MNVLKTNELSVLNVH